eukprot:6438039-Ditylum_brightwellii.AAC.1
MALLHHHTLARLRACSAYELYRERNVLPQALEKCVLTHCRQKYACGTQKCGHVTRDRGVPMAQDVLYILLNIWLMQQRDSSKGRIFSGIVSCKVKFVNLAGKYF